MTNYQGTDNLQLLEKTAKNYNTFLINLVTQAGQKRKEEKRKGITVADFGSGTAFFASQISQRLSTPVHCIEISENLFSYYKNKPDLILHNSLSELSDCSLDLIYSFNVLEHIKKDQDYINLFHQKLKKNGILVLYLPAFMCLYSSMDKKVGHYRRYTKSDLISKLSPNFEIIRCEYADSAGFFVTLLYKIFGSKNGEINQTALYIFDRFIFPISRFADKITMGKICGKNILCIAKKP